MFNKRVIRLEALIEFISILKPGQALELIIFFHFVSYRDAGGNRRLLLLALEIYVLSLQVFDKFFSHEYLFSRI